MEYGENAVQALSRELQEEFGGNVQCRAARSSSPTILFELDGSTLPRGLACTSSWNLTQGHHILGREGKFEAEEPNLVYQWLPLNELEEAELYPLLSP